MYLTIAVAPLLLANGVQAVACGKWYSTECLGATDVRYDQTYTNSIVEQNPKWSLLDGYWKASALGFDSNFQPSQPTAQFDAENPTVNRGTPYTRDKYTTYYNYTINESRISETQVAVFPPASEEFCIASQANIEPDNTLAFEGGTCGVTGYARFVRVFSTSVHEKDGNIKLLGGSVSNLAFKRFLAGSGGLGYTVGQDGIFMNRVFENLRGKQVSTIMHTFVNAEKTKLSMTRDNWNARGDEYFLMSTSRSIWEKISEEEFISGIQDEFEIHNVPEDLDSIFPINCDGGVCPTEDDWCKQDPNCSVSPYQEPEASLNAAVVGGTVGACAAILLLAGAGYYQWRLKQEKKRVTSLLAVKIARNLDFCVNGKEISKESISREFDSIDDSGDGVLQKAEVKAYIMGTGSTIKSSRNLLADGTQGSITDQEFETIFTVLDVDGNGEISFVEFVTFLNRCKAELDQMKARGEGTPSPGPDSA